MEFKQNLKELLKEKGIMQKEMIRELKLNPNFIQQADNPKADKLISIADFLDVSIDYLLDRTDNPNSHKC